MNAPEQITPPEGAALVAQLPISQLAASATNRKHDAAYIKDLAATVARHGVIQPITVRPWPAGRGKPPAGVLYEIVIGEGRWLAAKEAGHAEIPAFWRELTDEQALELQLIENLKRKDLTAIEEAEGYRRLMEDHGHTADTIAAQIGKSRSHVYAQLKLLDCGKKSRAALLEGKLDPSRALLIARIPTEKLQEQALEEILRPRWGNEPMSYRAAAQHIQEHYMLRLAEAPFPRNDPALIATAPSCHDCPKRTGSQPELFADVKSADVCTDPACFAAKKAAHTARVLAEAEARGQAVITGKAAEKIKPSRHSDVAGDFIALDDHCYAEGAKCKTYRELLGKKAPPPTLLEDPHEPGHLIEILPKTTIKEHLEAKGIQLNAKRPANDEQKKRERKAKIETTWRGRLFDAIRSHLTQEFNHGDAPVGGLKAFEFALVATTGFRRLGFDDSKRLVHLWHPPTDKKQDDHAAIAGFEKRLPELKEADHARLIIEMALIGEVHCGTWNDGQPKRLLAAAEFYGIDAEAIKAEVNAEFRAKEKAKTDKAKKPAKKPSTPTPAAQAKEKAAPAAAPAKAKKPAAAKKPKAKAKLEPAAARLVLVADAAEHEDVTYNEQDQRPGGGLPPEGRAGSPG